MAESEPCTEWSSRPSPFASGVYQLHVLSMSACRAIKYLRGVLRVIMAL